MSAAVYIDTSAFAKLYVSEAGSQSFQSYAARLGTGWISRLSVLEFRCMLARRVRTNMLTPSDQSAARNLFDADIARGLWQIAPIEDHHIVSAAGLIDRLAPLPLRTLDAMHLAVAQSLGSKEMATSDQTLATAGAKLGLRIAAI
jgi:predicted nucleic acid-binding protein